MAKQVKPKPIAIDDYLKLEEVLPAIKDQTVRLARSTSDFTVGVAKIYRSLLPLIELINRRGEITEQELHQALDQLFLALQQHPVTLQLRTLTSRMRSGNLLPNEQSTENLIRFLVEQVTARSIVPIPKQLTDEFWKFFDELMSEPELRGLGEVSLDVMRIVITAYEPLIAQLINQVKDLRQVNDKRMREILGNTRVIRQDLVIFRRQIGALRYIREFFDTDPNDFREQAEIVAQMVREFGPFFIKMAQVAAASSDFLPDEITEALAVFQEDVEPMTAAEVEQAFIECYGELPTERYFGFDASSPIKSGSIASVYLAQKPMPDSKGKQLLTPVVVKVGRHNLEREFQIGKTVIKLAILSSQYWAPHSKLSPFLSSWLGQVDVFVEGFRAELDFESEARNQARFAKRAAQSGRWHVPAVYHSTRRIIEMEFVDRAAGINSAFGNRGRNTVRARRKVGRAFLHTVISHLLIHQEFHGDLHPGNILVANDDELYLIDWGNTVDISAIWKPALAYLQAVLAGDAAGITRPSSSWAPTASRWRPAAGTGRACLADPGGGRSGTAGIRFFVDPLQGGPGGPDQPPGTGGQPGRRAQPPGHRGARRLHAPDPLPHRHGRFLPEHLPRPVAGGPGAGHRPGTGAIPRPGEPAAIVRLPAQAAETAYAGRAAKTDPDERPGLNPPTSAL